METLIEILHKVRVQGYVKIKQGELVQAIPISVRHLLQECS